MRSGARYLVLVAAALFAFGLFGAWHSRNLELQATVRHAGLQNAASSFVDTFSAEHQDTELRLMDERRELLLSASAWRVGGVLSLCLAALALFAAWLVRELRTWVVAVDGDAFASPRPDQAR